VFELFTLAAHVVHPNLRNLPVRICGIRIRMGCFVFCTLHSLSYSQSYIFTALDSTCTRTLLASWIL